MARRYRKDYVTRITGSQNWYIQFRIKDSYRQLPFFINNPKWNNRDKYLSTLRTPDYLEALRLVKEFFEEIGILQKPLPKPLSTGTEAYFENLRKLKSCSMEELEQMYDYFLDMRNHSVDEKDGFSGETEITDEQRFDHYSKALEAIQREFKEREIPFYSQPYPYQISLLQLAEHYRNEIIADGADKKTQSKLHHSVKKLLEFRGVTDIEVSLIKPKLINEYARFSRQNDVAEGTMRSELAALSNIWKYGIRNEYLQEGINPFANVQLKGFKNKASRKPFTAEMLIELLKASKSDADMEQLIMCSYYSGMRLSEIFAVKFNSIGDILCFDVASDGGKTEAAKRLIPIHNDLRPWLEQKYNLNNSGGLKWSRKTHDSVGKKFGRLKNIVLDKIGITDPEQKKEYVHHSFRHGFVTMLIEAGFNEIEFADLTGHSKSFLGRTEAGKTYAGTAHIKKLKMMIESLPHI